MKYTKISLGFATPGVLPKTYVLTIRREAFETLQSGQILELEVAKCFPKTEWSPMTLYHVHRKSIRITKSKALEKAYVSRLGNGLNFYVGNVFAKPESYETVLAMFIRPKKQRNPQV